MDKKIHALNNTYGDLRYDLEYVSDPRLIDAPRAQYLNLNRPPLTGQVEENEIYDECVVGRGWPQYSSFKDIHKGQIMYYTDELSRPFFLPNFSEGRVSINCFTDPMGARKRYYDLCSVPNLCNKYMDDTTFFRGDLMAKRLQSLNKYDYMVPLC